MYDRIVIDVDVFAAAITGDDASRSILALVTSRELAPLCSPELMEVYARALEEHALRGAIAGGRDEARKIAYGMAHFITPVDIDAFELVFANDQALAAVVATARSGDAAVIVTFRPGTVAGVASSSARPGTPVIEALMPDQYLRRIGR